MTSGRAFGRGVRREFFDRVCSGSPVKHAARAVGVSHQAGVAWWRDAGSMTLVRGSGARGLAYPGDLRRPGGVGHRLSFSERIEIMRGRDAGLKPAEIGRRIGRDRSVICREIARNSNPDGDYHGGLAHGRASRKARRPKAFKLRGHPTLCAAVEDWMDDGWSPRLIAEVLARDHRGDKLMQVSRETIYQCLYVQTRGSLRADLHKRLSTKRSARKPRGHPSRTGVYTPGEIFTISDRPAEAVDRAVPGHWEGDLILGARNSSAIGTLVERATRFTILLHLPAESPKRDSSRRSTSKALPEYRFAAIRWPHDACRQNHVHFGRQPRHRPCDRQEGRG